MSKAEQRRVDVLTRLSAKMITLERAGELLDLSTRQVRRVYRRYMLEGVASVPHGNRGRAPHNVLSPETAARVMELSGETGCYSGFNVCHMRDMLATREGIRIGRSTLHKLLHPKPAVPVLERPVRGVVRRRRLRSAAEGMMVQIDGSPHKWLEDRAPMLCMIGGIDDATGRVVHGHFRANEDANGYLFMFRDIAVRHGLPMSYYHDKHTILRSPKKTTIEEDMAGEAPMSHVQRVMHDLGIESIAAHSPQAKGRIERLWSTFQDRLVKEMRLYQVNTMEEANVFLNGFIARHNAQFAVEPADANSAWVELEPGFDLDYYFSMQETRTVKEDHTLSFEGKVFQIRAASRNRSLAGQRVSVRVNPEGIVRIYDGHRQLQHSQIVTGLPKPKQITAALERPTKPPIDPRKAARRRGYLYAAA